MKSYLIVILVCLNFFSFGQSQSVEKETPARMFGSMDSLLNNVSDKLILPDGCDQSGVVAVEFVLKNDGTKENFKVIIELCDYADSIAVQIVKELKFSPRKINNSNVASKKVMSIPFRIKEK